MAAKATKKTIKKKAVPAKKKHVVRRKQVSRSDETSSEITLSDVLPKRFMFDNEQISQLEIDQLKGLLPQIEFLLTKKKKEILVIEQYGQRLDERFHRINEQWGLSSEG